MMGKQAQHKLSMPPACQPSARRRTAVEMSGDSPPEAHALPPLLAAARDGDTAMVRAVLAGGTFGVDTAAPGGSTALHLAAYGGHGECVQALLDAGAEKEVRNSTGKRAYDYAREQGHRGIAELLMDAPSTAAEAQRREREAAQAEAEARRRGQEATEAAAALDRLNTALLNAARGGDIDRLRKCLAGGADASCRDRFGQSPLHLAAVTGNADAVRFLLDAGAALDAANGMGHTPGDVARAKGHTQLARLLTP